MENQWGSYASVMEDHKQLGNTNICLMKSDQMLQHLVLRGPIVLSFQ